MTYEECFAETLGLPFAVSFWKGRTALYAILKSLGIGSGDEVILPGFTCVVVPNAVRFVGATPVYVDITAKGYNIDPCCVADAITPRTRALIIQHTFGIPADFEPLLEIANKHSLLVIEDCAHSLGSTYNGCALGSVGDAAFFSSQWSKPYTTGLGGIAATKKADLAVRLKELRSAFANPPVMHRLRLRTQYLVFRWFFSPKMYWFAMGMLKGLSSRGLFVGSSGETELKGDMPPDTEWRMSTCQRRWGLTQLRRLGKSLQHRKELGQYYHDALRASGWPASQELGDQADTVLLRYPVNVRNKWELLKLASEERVELGSWFESPLHPTPTAQMAAFGYELGRCPNGEATAEQVVNLPLHLKVTRRDADRMLEFLFKYGAPVG